MAGSIDLHKAKMPAGRAGISLGPISLIPRGEGRCFSVGRFRIAVFHQRDDTLFALDNACPHQGGPLADGVIGAGMVVCPLHAHRFRLVDGSGVDTSLRARTFAVEIHDGCVFVQIPVDA